jgi:hypothetical protein
MVARINTSAKLGSVLRYNEKKVAQDKAVLIHAKGFLQEKDRLTAAQKTERFQRLNELNSRSKVNTLHVSINFHKNDRLTDEMMVAIADRYMEGIGMADQPYLVYRHLDAGHPHMHIVSTLIQPDGRRIRTQNMGRNQSARIRKAIEKEFNLIPAQQNKSKGKEHSNTEPARKVVYSPDHPLGEQIQRVLNEVNRDYAFASLPEYNAILRQYNVVADTGGENSRARKHGGLYYRALDEKGHRVGPPLKASGFEGKPTLARLQKKFEEGKDRRRDMLPNLRQKIDWAIRQNPSSLKEFIEALQQEGVEAVIYQTGATIYGLTYIDNENKIAIKGSDLGKAYGAGGIREALHLEKDISLSNQYRNKPASRGGYASLPEPGNERKGTQPQGRSAQADDYDGQGFNPTVPQILSDLMKHDQSFGTSPNEFQEDQRIRQRRRRL